MPLFGEEGDKDNQLWSFLEAYGNQFKKFIKPPSDNRTPDLQEEDLIDFSGKEFGKFAGKYPSYQYKKLAQLAKQSGVPPLIPIAHAIAEGYEGLTPDWASMFDPQFLNHLQKEGLIKLGKSSRSINWKKSKDPLSDLSTLIGKPLNKSIEEYYTRSQQYHSNIERANFTGIDPNLLAIQRLKFLLTKYKNEPDAIKHQAWQGLGKIGITERPNVKRWFGNLAPGTTMRDYPEHGKRVQDLIRALSKHPRINELIGD